MMAEPGRWLYYHSGKGFWIGSDVIVLANSEESARAMIRSELNRIGLADEKIQIDQVRNLATGVIFSRNGDC